MTTTTMVKTSNTEGEIANSNSSISTKISAKTSNKKTAYISKQPDEQGHIAWSKAENLIWKQLIQRQLSQVEEIACDEYLHGLSMLNLPQDRIPQLKEVSAVLNDTTGWQCYPVPALIGFGEFFKLLSERKFPVATFIRNEKELDYLQEPDIFHEIFGHCPLLTNQSFADFTQAYGKMGLNATKEQRVFLARLYWFTVEFGLVQTQKGLKIYGGGIISSPSESYYALNNKDITLNALSKSNVIDVLRTPYRIDVMQPVYFILNNLNELNAIREYEVEEIMQLIEQAKSLGLFEAKFEKKSVN
ncbi:MAG: phenylalanine 4-monooxygenase [Colwellia sp.]